MRFTDVAGKTSVHHQGTRSAPGRTDTPPQMTHTEAHRHETRAVLPLCVAHPGHLGPARDGGGPAEHPLARRRGFRARARLLRHAPSLEPEPRPPGRPG